MAGRVDRAVVGLLAPLVVVGVALTVSVFGAVFGLPILALVVPPTWVAWSGGVGGRAAVHPRLFWSLLPASVVFPVGVVAGVVVGWGDVDSVVEAVAVGVALGWAVLLVGLTWALGRRASGGGEGEPDGAGGGEEGAVG